MSNTDTIEDLKTLARKWASKRDAATKMGGSSFVVVGSGTSVAQREFILAMEGCTAELVALIGSMSAYEWEAMSELMYMTKNSPLTPSYKE